MLPRLQRAVMRRFDAELVCGGCGRAWPDEDPAAVCATCRHSRFSRRVARRRPSAHLFLLRA